MDKTSVTVSTDTATKRLWREAAGEQKLTHWVVDVLTREAMKAREQAPPLFDNPRHARAA